MIDKDETKDALHGILSDSDAGHRAYAITLEMAEAALRRGTSVIYDSPLPFPTLYEELRGIAARTGARLCVVECRCPDDNELRLRIEGRRGAGLSPHRITRWTDFLSYRRKIADPADYPIASPLFSADTSLPLSILTANLLDWLNERFPPTCGPSSSCRDAASPAREQDRKGSPRTTE